MNTVDLINNLLKRSDGALDQLKLHYGPLIRYVISPFFLTSEIARKSSVIFWSAYGIGSVNLILIMAAGPTGYLPSPETPQSTGPEEILLQVPNWRKRFLLQIQIRNRSCSKRNGRRLYIWLWILWSLLIKHCFTGSIITARAQRKLLQSMAPLKEQLKEGCIE